jgi:Arc/MetJ-type ribon-helix-helix transcriptional regulator
MGLKSLIKKPVLAEVSVFDKEAAATAFISGAPVSASKSTPRATRKKSTHAYVRTTFSLSHKVNKQIDKISCAPTAFRVSRSDVVRAGVMALMAMNRAERVALLERVCTNELAVQLVEDDGDSE